MADERAGECVHRFAPTGRWWKRTWTCIFCDLVTREYDGADRMALRPIHKHMTVAVRGFNTVVRP